MFHRHVLLRIGRGLRLVTLRHSVRPPTPSLPQETVGNTNGSHLVEITQINTRFYQKILGGEPNCILGGEWEPAPRPR